LFGFISIFCNEGITAQDNRVEAIEYLKEKALVVRLYMRTPTENEYKRLSESESVPEKLRVKMHEKYLESSIENDSFLRRFIEIWQNEYLFGKVVFVPGDLFDDFQAGKRDSVFMNEKLELGNIDFEIGDKYVYTYRTDNELIYHYRNAKNEKIKDFIQTSKMYRHTSIFHKTGDIFFGKGLKRYDEKVMERIRSVVYQLNEDLSYGQF
jgi:hypothetical protein